MAAGHRCPAAANQKVEMKKKAKDALKKQREAIVDIKEFRLSVNIDIHDFNTRVTNTNESSADVVTDIITPNIHKNGAYTANDRL